MADLHSAAGNESRCSCFARAGTNPGCPAHGNHATRPAESAVDGPTGPGAGEDTGGPGWDRERVQDLIRRVKTAEPGDGWYEAKDGDGALLDALLYDAESYQRSAERHQRALAEHDAARAALATARNVADQWRKVATRNEWISAAHALCRVLAALDGETDHTIPPTDRSSG